MIRFVGSPLTFGAPRSPLPRATLGVAPKRTLSSERSPPTPSYTTSTPWPPVSAFTSSRKERPSVISGRGTRASPGAN